jgi:hypothetical protein
MKIRSRIEWLEEELLPPPPQPRRFINVQFVDSDLKVVSTMVVELPQTSPRGGRLRYPRIGRRW